MNRREPPLTRGTEILTHATLGEIQGMIVSADNLAWCRLPARAKIAGIVTGHGSETQAERFSTTLEVP